MSSKATSSSPSNNKPITRNGSSANSTGDILKAIAALQSSHEKLLKLNQQNSAKQSAQFDEIKLNLGSISSQISELKTENSNLRIELTTLKDKVHLLENAHIDRQGNTTSMSSQDGSNIMNEVHDRLRRSNNIIVYNVPDPADESQPALGLADDLFKDLSLSCGYITARRLGKPGHRPRPLLVELKSAGDVSNLLHIKSKLRRIDRWKDVWVNRDLTAMQRAHFASLRAKLRSKHADGDLRWIIKHVNGSPCLVQKN